MGIELNLISKELIKPSCPTPHHLCKFNLSFIDQLQHPNSMPFVFFYEKPNLNSSKETSNFLKKSLSKTLSLYYPLTGRINNNSYVDCNDEGALFYESEANCSLSYILENRNEFYNHFKKYIPSQPDKLGLCQYGSLFQITYFTCGGFALSFAMPHMLGDGLSQLTFLRSWAAVARGDAIDNIAPHLASDSVFPRRTQHGFGRIEWSFKEDYITKSFVFDDATILALRGKLSRTNGEKLSRVQALSVFLVTRMMNMMKSKGSLVINLMNLRPLVDPPIPKYSFGNMIWMPIAAIDKNDESHEIGRKIRDSIASVNADTVKKLQSDEQFDFLMDKFGVLSDGEMKKYTVSSLCNFPAYEIDFGWGKPEWITTSGMISDNVLMIFVDTKEGRGIEAWISMTKEDMVKFENDEQLISHLYSARNGNPNLIKKSRL